LMKLIVDKIVGCARIAVVLLAVLAIVVSGAGTAARLFSEQTLPTETPESKATATLDHLPDPEEATGEMATGGQPWTEQPAFWQVIPALPGNSGQARIGPGPGIALKSVSTATHIGNVNSLFATSSLVDSRIGHRSTLVGSKPSGTS
jgi:hypothetical protein